MTYHLYKPRAIRDMGEKRGIWASKEAGRERDIDVMGLAVSWAFCYDTPVMFGANPRFTELFA